ncbi:hypothetical protein AWB79_06624 [Caballeronia hypogeia]|uniref:Replication protein O n=1 Tax=Caballeronia hypogeia TaxID=1777140 RepID=A0A158DAD3_9BURK|nr:replication protein O [Caballeronia hypogeia]SAK90767.1 hypothetical protein AWB79_06624 [Caballeronia hypogeia]
MRIAQHSVAGEAESCPNTREAITKAGDQQALDEFACDRSNLPWVIFRAAHRATHTAALPARARALLAALARTVDAARPYAAIFARRELLTGRAQQSMRTFYRSMDDLEQTGFIARPPQTRYGAAGLFGRAYIHLTPKAATLLGLVETSSDTEAPRIESPEHATQVATSPSLATPSATVADRAIYKDLIPSTQKRQPGRLPADLTRLLSLGFREFLIFKLMREAKLHDKLLSDVVEASWDHLRRATHPISYLRTLLKAPVDFAYRVRSNRATSVEQARERAVEQRSEEAVNGIAGQSFVSRDGLRHYQISDDATSVTIQHRDEPRPRVHAGSWARDFVAAVDAGHILRVGAQNHADQIACLRRPTAGHEMQPQSVRGSAAGTIAAHIDELKHLLRLKRAGVAPRCETEKETDSAARGGPLSACLESLLKGESAIASAP